MADVSEIKIGYLNIMDHLMVEWSGANTNADVDNDNQNDFSDAVEIVRFNSWRSVTDALCEGRVQGAFIPLPEALTLFSKGLNIRVLFLDSRLGTSVVANRVAGISKLTDFIGKSVLLSCKNSVHFLLFHQLMERAGIRVHAEKIGPGTKKNQMGVTVEVVPPAMVPEMMGCDVDGDIGGCMVEEPYASLLITLGIGKRVCHSGMLWPDHPHTALVVGYDALQHHEEALAVWIKKMMEAHGRIYEDKQSKTLVGFSRFYFDNVNSILENEVLKDIPFSPLSLIPDIQLLETINDVMVKKIGGFSRMAPMTDFVDTRFFVQADA